MPNFQYKAIDPSGKTIAGDLDAEDRKSVVQKLSARGFRPVSIHQSQQALSATEAVETKDFFKSSTASGKRRRTLLRTGRKKLALEFLKRLLVLLSAGMSMGDAVRLMSARLSDPEMKALCENIWKHLSEGHTLASAMASLDGTFAPASIHLVEAGEASGNLVPVIERIVAHMEETNTVRKNLVASLTYPFVVLGFSLVVIVILLSFMLPKVEAILGQLGGDLPLITKLLVEGSHFLAFWGPILLVAGLLGALAIRNWRKTATGRQKTDYWLLRVPLIGRIYLYSNIFATTNLMGTLLASGVNTTETLRLVEKTINNEILRAKFAVARRQIQEGVSMATAIQRVHYMPDLAMDILTVGENTGNVVTSLHDINGIYREELSKSLSFLTSATVTIALGTSFALVAVIAISIVYAVLSVGQSIQL